VSQGSTWMVHQGLLGSHGEDSRQSLDSPGGCIERFDAVTELAIAKLLIDLSNGFGPAPGDPRDFI
jgi:hypothetical protein